MFFERDYKINKFKEYKIYFFLKEINIKKYLKKIINT